VTTVTTQARERDKNFARVGNDSRSTSSGESLIANARSDIKQAIELSATAVQQRRDFIPIQRDPTLGPAEGPHYLPLIN
jgi:hypothetical protein